MKTVSVEQGAGTYDFVVVGGGSAGAAMAARLSENRSVSVLLVEAGDEATELNSKIPAACGAMQNTERDWAYFTEPCGRVAFKGLNKLSSFWPRGRVLGGCSVLNYMAYVRGAREDFDTWERMGAKGWSYSDVLPYFIKSEDCRALGNKQAPIEGEYHGRGGPLTVSVKKPMELSMRFIESAQGLGFKHADYNGRQMDGIVGLFAQTIRDGARCDTATAFLKPAADRPNLTIMTNAFAKRLLFDGSSQTRVVGVEVGNFSTKGIGPSVKVSARCEVVVCCGAIDSPKLLLLSGLGPREHLEAVGVPCVKDMQHVGRNLEDHIAGFVYFKTKNVTVVNGKTANSIQSLAEWAIWGTGALASSAYDATLFYKSDAWKEEEPLCGPDLQIGIFNSPSDETFIENNLGFANEFLKKHYTPSSEGYIMVPTLLHPHTTGTVELRSSNPADAPRILSNFLQDERDVRTLAQSCRKCIDLARAPGLNKVTDPVPVVPEEMAKKHGGIDSDEFWMDYVQHFGTTLYHPTSSCAIGKVVDERCRVYGIEGLRVADASVMPQVISGNTNAPSIMIGEKAADMIKEDYGLSTDDLTIGPQESASSPINMKLIVAAAAVAGGLFAAGKL
ncbi:Glucose dehydrogenase FAD, quinone [Hondaea fermentalgiana]|uniref:Glucose dehydrogenase FAD, quinone n=1 Tax=Hondaea fermentalgiana TaxID=2315210 RepID=A0A2R5GBY9_9STRA|nr:Glucose dehydrogenase FAD, quinone [Hondaea fermentalgiana]|eukprot:GBG26093.1 Glucose dehydrogenase FAD, quinone [Hondaea fermentalgiana]